MGKGIKSIRTKLTLIMTAMLCFMISIIWIMNKVFLPAYYQYEKVSMLEGCYSRANMIVSDDEKYINGEADMSDSSTLGLEILAANNASNIYVFRLTDILGTVYYTYDYPGADVLASFIESRFDVSEEKSQRKDERFHLYDGRI